MVVIMFLSLRFFEAATCWPELTHFQVGGISGLLRAMQISAILFTRAGSLHFSPPGPFQTKASEGGRGPVTRQLGMWDKMRMAAGLRVWPLHSEGPGSGWMTCKMALAGKGGSPGGEWPEQLAGWDK